MAKTRWECCQNYPCVCGYNAGRTLPAEGAEPKADALPETYRSVLTGWTQPAPLMPAPALSVPVTASGISRGLQPTSYPVYPTKAMLEHVDTTNFMSGDMTFTCDTNEWFVFDRDCVQSANKADIVWPRRGPGMWIRQGRPRP